MPTRTPEIGTRLGLTLWQHDLVAREQRSNKDGRSCCHGVGGHFVARRHHRIRRRSMYYKTER